MVRKKGCPSVMKSFDLEVKPFTSTRCTLTRAYLMASFSFKETELCTGVIEAPLRGCCGTLPVSLLSDVSIFWTVASLIAENGFHAPSRGHKESPPPCAPVSASVKVGCIVVLTSQVGCENSLGSCTHIKGLEGCLAHHGSTHWL